MSSGGGDSGSSDGSCGSGRGCGSNSRRREAVWRCRYRAVRATVVAAKAAAMDFDGSGARGGSSSSGVLRGVVDGQR